MVHLATELERIFPIKCNALLTHNSALRRNGMRQSELNVNLHKKDRCRGQLPGEAVVSIIIWYPHKNVISIGVTSYKLWNLSFSYLSMIFPKNGQLFFRISSLFCAMSFANFFMAFYFQNWQITLMTQKYKKPNFFATMKMFLTLTFRL